MKPLLRSYIKYYLYCSQSNLAAAFESDAIGLDNIFFCLVTTTADMIENYIEY